MPESLYQDVASAHFSEYTLLRAWMKQWLNSVQWYYTATSFLVYASGLDQPKARSGSIHIECDSPKAISHELVR